MSLIPRPAALNEPTDDLVSIVIPVFNGERYVEATLRSALEQTYAHIEVIVVDDGSSDRTLEILSAYADRITLLRQPNAGVCVARNTGAATARGRYIAFLDSDDLWEPEKIERQVDIFRRHPAVGLVGTWHDEIDDRGAKLNRRAKRRADLMGKVIRPYDELLRNGNFLSVSACLMRRDVFDASGGFHSRERILSGDYDLWIRLSEHHPFYVIPEALCHYRVLANSQIHGSLAKEYGAQLNILRMHQGRFSARAFRRRLSRLYLDWADSAFFEGHPEGWPKWREAVALDPFGPHAWLIAARVIAGRALRGARGFATARPR